MASLCGIHCLRVELTYCLFHCLVLPALSIFTTAFLPLARPFIIHTLLRSTPDQYPHPLDVALLCSVSRLPFPLVTLPHLSLPPFTRRPISSSALSSLPIDPLPPSPFPLLPLFLPSSCSFHHKYLTQPHSPPTGAHAPAPPPAAPQEIVDTFQSFLAKLQSSSGGPASPSSTPKGQSPDASAKGHTGGQMAENDRVMESERKSGNEGGSRGEGRREGSSVSGGGEKGMGTGKKADFENFWEAPEALWRIPEVSEREVEAVMVSSFARPRFTPCSCGQGRGAGWESALERWKARPGQRECADCVMM